MRNSQKSVSDKFVSPDSPHPLSLLKIPSVETTIPVKALSLGGHTPSVKEV